MLTQTIETYIILVTCGTSRYLSDMIKNGVIYHSIIMMDRKITSTPNMKIPVHVPIYNMLYSDIINGLYKEGDKLPSESILTEKYSVSRHTLRMALAILSEDGLIRKHQGKGSIVIYEGIKKNVNGRRIYNPIIHGTKVEIDSIDISYNYGPPTRVAQRKMGIKATEIVMASNNIYSSNGVRIGHAFIQIPVKYIGDINLDINSKEDISHLLNNTIFEMAESAKMTVKLVNAEENIVTFLQNKPNEPVMYIEEILYKDDNQGLARCKFYFLPDKFEISIDI